MKTRSHRQFEPTDKEQLAQQQDREVLPSFDHKYFVQASALGGFPGQNIIDSIYRVRGELGAPHLPVFPELPQRGYHATTLARTICCLEGLSADGTASGWRIRTGRLAEGERANTLLNSDINALADVIGTEKSQETTPYKVTLLGPVSLAASVYRNNGELLLSDYGARRDILQSFVEGIQPWFNALNEATHHAPIVLQLDEPHLENAMAGAIPTSSGYKTHRYIPLHEVEATFAYLAETLKPYVQELVIRAPGNLKQEVYREFDAAMFSLEESDRQTWENLARLIESDKKLLLGVQNPEHYATVSERAHWFFRNWRTVGLPVSSLPRIVLTEAGGLTAVDPDVATTVLHHLTELSRAVSELASDVN